MKLSFRTFCLFVFLSCIGVLGYALYLQHYRGLLPCPLCVVQRMAYIVVAVAALGGVLYSPGRASRMVYSAAMAIFASIGVIVAARHAWVVHHPELSTECGISPEEKFLNALPFAKWWPGMFEANGDCASVTWKFLSLTIPEWSLILFLFIGIAALLALAAQIRGRPRNLFSSQ